MSNNSNENRIYGMAPGMARVQYGIAGFLGLLPVVFAIVGCFDPAFFAVALLVGLIQVPFMAYLIRNVRRMKIGLSPSGIVFTNVVGRELRLAWDEIESLDSTMGHEGFVLKTPLQSPAALRLADTAGIRFQGNSMYTPNEEAHLAGCCWVPMRSFAGWLRQGAMLRDLERFAPRLAGQYLADKDRRNKEQEKSRDAVTVAVVISVMLVIPTIAIAASGVELPADVASKLNRVIEMGEALLMCLLALVLAVTSFVNAKAAIAKLAQRRLFACVLWGFAAIFQTLLAILALGAGLGVN